MLNIRNINKTNKKQSIDLKIKYSALFYKNNNVLQNDYVITTF